MFRRTPKAYANLGYRVFSTPRHQQGEMYMKHSENKAHKITARAVWCITVAMIVVALIVFADCLVTGQSCDEEAKPQEHGL